MDIIFGSRSNSIVSFTSNQATAKSDGMFAYRGIGLNSVGNQMKKDVFCYSNCNQMKDQNNWVNKSNGWDSVGWTNADDPNGTGDHEKYRLV